MVYGPNLKKNTKSRKPIYITIIVIVAVALVGFFGYRWWQQRKLTQAQQQSPNPQTELGNDTTTDESSTNTSEQNQKLSGSQTSTSPSGNTSNALPTPLLAKSSGNNGSVPAGANIEFLCTTTASYSCSIRLTGPKTINLDKKTLTDNGRGEFGASWIWAAEKGSWTVAAIISDAQGAQKSSATQTLEVR